MKTNLRKLLVTIVLLTSCSLASGQERFTISINTEPVAWKDGVNIGADITYEQELPLYHSAGFYLFPDLNGVGYTQIHGVPVGLNIRLRDTRLYSGLLLGVNIREGNPNPIWGNQSGIDHYFKGFGLGLGFTYIERSDAEFYGGPKWMFNGSVRFIILL